MQGPRGACRRSRREPCADLLRERAESGADEVVRDGGRAAAAHCDVSDRAVVRKLKAQADAAFGTVSLLFANAGVTSFERLTDMSAEAIDWIIEVDLRGVSNCLHAFLPGMIAQRSGHVMATASLVGLIPSLLPDHAPYCAAKAGVIAMMLNLRTELSEVGVGCGVLCPGGVRTRIHETPRDPPPRFGGSSEEPLRAPHGYAPTGKIEFQSPEEVAERVLFGVRENRPMVVTDAGQRARFLESYVDLVSAAFDDAAGFDGMR